MTQLSTVFRLTLFLITLLLTIGPAVSVPAAGPPVDPVLRIETGSHTAAVKRLATDIHGRWLVSASEDKTVRVWDLAGAGMDDGSSQPVRIIRPPIGEGDTGKLYALALSPDGNTIACGGWTRFVGEQGHTIYIFNRTSGEMTGRIGGLPEVIHHLAISPDGRYLAASLGGKHGVRLYRTADWSQAGEDRDYATRCMAVHFSSTGRLAASSYDGYIRLYDVSRGGLRLIAKEKAPDGNQPFGIRFSPDGGGIAVGYEDSLNVSIISGRDLSPLRTLHTPPLNDANLYRVTWSDDGRFLYAAGRYRKKINNVWQRVVRRWSDGGWGGVIDMAATNNTIMDLAPLPDGRLVFCSFEMGVLDQYGGRSLIAVPATADFRDNQEKFRVSGDGATVAFGYEVWGKAPASFDLATRILSRGAISSLPAPLTVSDGLAVTGWKNTDNPLLNGVPIKLKQHETSRALAIAPDGASFVLGAEWSLRRYDRQGKLLWRQAVPGAVRAVNVARNGLVVVAAYGDGTIRWHGMRDGRELLAFFPHADRKRWVLWTPGGYYDASPGGEELIGWHVNNGRDRAADFFPSARFRATYYRPDVVARMLETLDEGEALRLANTAGNRSQENTTVTSQLPPVISILSPSDGTSVSSSPVTIRYQARTPGGAPVTSLRILIDGRPVSLERGLKIVPKAEADQSIAIPIPERDCMVSLVAENRHSASEPATVRLRWAGARRTNEEFAVKPRLYALSVGVSAYRDKELVLRFAAKDATDFAAALARQKEGLYRDVVVKTLTDVQATKDEILDGLEWLQREVTSKDVGIVFIAGHGVNDSTGNFYYLPQNADPDRLKRTGVAFSDLKTTLNSLAGKAILFVDTCHSGNVMGARRGVADINAIVNELSSAENGVVVFASSTGRQYSLEDDRWNNGAFTKALVEGLNGKADLLGKGKITINMLDAWLADRVKELTGGRQTPTTTKPQTIQDFPIAVKK